MPRPERVSSIEDLACLKVIAENCLGDETEGENVCEALNHGSANSDHVRPTWELISSDGYDSETDIDGLEQRCTTCGLRCEIMRPSNIIQNI